MKGKTRTCSICGETYTPKSETQQCCSSKCANIKAHNTTKKYYSCQYCGEPFWRKNAFRMKYCCKDCRDAARKETVVPKENPKPTTYKRECAWCGKPFETTYSKKKCCCPSCSYENNKKNKREQWAEKYIPKTITCRECGLAFTTECGNKHSVFCCTSCAEKYERRVEHASNRHKDYMKEMKKKRERQIKESFVENVSYIKIYERDNGLCRICGLPVIKDKFASSNWSGTIDHIIPLSSGGEHSMDNCQLAHRICNSLKCKCVGDYHIDWKAKSKENNYWKIRFEELNERLSL